jgi:Kef-type K+ transport system membrane component KefB
MFIFLVGVEMDRHLLRRRGRAALLTSHASIAVPMFFGVALAMALYTRMAPMGVAFTPFALFLGAAMSVTAFPVLVRILNERKMQHTETGMIAIASAAIDDVTAWCVLALVVVIARSESTALPLWATLTGLGLHVALMLSVVRPLLQKYAARVLDADGITSALVGTIVIVTLGSAWLTEVLGVHALFGAFLAGIVMPKDERFVAGVKQRFEDVMLVLLLPLFFAYSGLRANVTLLHGWEAWGTCLAITGVAVAGKLLGSTAASRAADCRGVRQARSGRS